MMHFINDAQRQFNMKMHHDQNNVFLTHYPKIHKKNILNSIKSNAMYTNWLKNWLKNQCNIFHRIEISFCVYTVHCTLFVAFSFHSFCGCNAKSQESDSTHERSNENWDDDWDGCQCKQISFRCMISIQYKKNVNTICLLTDKTFGFWSDIELFEFCLKFLTN